MFFLLKEYFYFTVVFSIGSIISPEVLLLKKVFSLTFQVETAFLKDTFNYFATDHHILQYFVFFNKLNLCFVITLV